MMLVTFGVASDAGPGTTPIVFAPSWTPPRIGSVTGGLLPATYTSGSVEIFNTPTQSKFSISGKVLTPRGAGLRNATVRLTSASDGSVWSASTGSFGIYTFTDLPGEGQYTVSVASRRYGFASRTMFINQNLTNVDLIAQE